MIGIWDRCHVAMADMADPVNDILQAGVFDVIVSGYAIHHLPDENKRRLYQTIFDALSPGGLFVNIEHVSSPTRELEAMWDEVTIESLCGQSGRPYETVAKEHHNRPDRADNILAPVETQVEWLREIGFIHADCYFKFLELAVFGGVKPAGG